MNTLNNAPLGKTSEYISTYTPGLLFAIPRLEKRLEIGIKDESLPFTGEDVWNAYEISWLNKKGKPQVAIGRFIIPCTSPNIIESKSFKLYLNSFNNSKFDSIDEVQNIISKDLSLATKENISAQLTILNDTNVTLAEFSGTCLDNLDINCDEYTPQPGILTTNSNIVTETLYSNLLKSNCLVTGQPDWGSVLIHYTGSQIDKPNLLKYIVSFRNHNEFHEQCVERIFVDIQTQCRPSKLLVSAAYTRRGGLDINPQRSNCDSLKFGLIFRQLRQ